MVSFAFSPYYYTTEAHCSVLFFSDETAGSKMIILDQNNTECTKNRTNNFSNQKQEFTRSC